MSTARKPSSIGGLRRGLGTDGASSPPEIGQRVADLPAPHPAGRARPVRVTLNLPPDLFRQLNRWADDAADQVDVPRVSVQDALRAMVRAGVSDPAASDAVLRELRADSGSIWRDAAREHAGRQGL